MSKAWIDVVDMPGPATIINVGVSAVRGASIATYPFNQERPECGQIIFTSS